MSTLRKTFLSRFLGQRLLYGLLLSLYCGISITSLHARPLFVALRPTETIGSNPILKPPKPIKTKPPPKATDTPTATVAAPTATDTPTPSNPTVSATATNALMPPTATPIPPATVIDTPTPTLAGAQIALTKTDFLFTDADSNNLASPGDKLLYVITLNNTGQRTAQQLHLVDTLDANTALVAGTVKTDQGRVVQGDNLGDTRVVFELDSLAPDAQVTLSFQVGIKLQVNAAQVQNQAVVTFGSTDGAPTGQMVVISDDPDSPEALDATVTPLNSNQIHQQPKLFLPLVSRKE